MPVNVSVHVCFRFLRQRRFMRFSAHDVNAIYMPSVDDGQHITERIGLLTARRGLSLYFKLVYIC